MALLTYSTGTVSVAAGGTGVTGIDTIWSGLNAVAGDVISIDGADPVLITDIVDVDALVIPAWQGGAKSNVPYVIYQCSSLRFSDVQIALDMKKQVQALNTEGFFVFVPVSASSPDPSLGDEGQYAFQPATGKLWAKESGIWTFLGIYKVLSPRGIYDPDASYLENDVVLKDGTSYLVIAPTTGHAPPNPTYFQVLAAKGDPGTDGDDGAAATISVGAVTTLSPGATATVTNSGTSSEAVFDIGIPRGEPGMSGLLVVRTVATANVSIASALEAGDAVSGVTLAANDLVLLTAQTAPAENGIYVVPAAGAAARHASFAIYDSHPGCYFSACEGAGVADTLWRCTSDRGGTLGTTALTFSQFTAGGDVAGDTHAAAGKSTPVDADELPLVDSAASNVLKKLTWANLKATLASWLVSAGFIRDKLTANRTYYVRTDGSDSNNGLANTSGGAFLTIQKAWNTILTLDLAGNTVTIQLADGTYTAGLSISAPALGGTVILNGNSSTPTNVVISTTNCISLSAPGSAITVQNMRLSGSTMGLLVSSPGAMITMGPGLSFAGSPTQSHINIRQGKVSSAGNNFTIASGGLGWLLVQQYGVFETADLTITFSGTPAWTSEGIIAVSGLVSLWNTIISGAATGKRYAVSANGFINSFGAGTSSTYFPGSSNGTTSTGGGQS